MKDLMQETKEAIADYEKAAATLDNMDLVGGYVIRCQNVYLTFDVSDAGDVMNPRPCRPHLARSFTWLQAKAIASHVCNGGQHAGEVVHVRQAVAEVLDAYRAVLGTLEAFERGDDPAL
jgi:hypothetical protein